MRERPITLGKNKELVGVVTEPAPGQRDAGRPACILVNAGLIHRVGPNRLYVNLARRLAGTGMVTLRLDLSGRGDSDVSKDARSFTESAIGEIRAAMDALETSRQCRQFVIGGICSGAINALQVAIADERVAGGIMIDGPAYPTPGYYARYYARRLFSRESWKNTLEGRNAIGRLLRPGRGKATADEVEEGNEYERGARPSTEQAAQYLLGIVNRGARLLFVFSGSWSAYNYERQFADAFPSVMRTGAVDVVFFPDSDHTFTGGYNQERLISTIVRFFDARWPRTQAAAVSQRPDGIPSEIS